MEFPLVHLVYRGEDQQRKFSLVNMTKLYIVCCQRETNYELRKKTTDSHKFWSWCRVLDPNTGGWEELSLNVVH